MSPVAHRPVIRDMVLVRIQTPDLVGTVWMRCAVRHDGRVGSDPFEAVPYVGRNAHEAIVRVPDEELLQFTSRVRSRTLVVYDELDVPERHRVEEGHLSVHVPGLDRARIHEGKIDLPEALEMSI